MRNGVNMDRVPVTSSNLASIGYDEASLTLEIEFIGGRVYQYFDVPPAAYAELISADSHGVYFCAYIRNNYRYARL
jgi:hypothetical protein